jgi:hypothetical protein
VGAIVFNEIGTLSVRDEPSSFHLSTQTPLVFVVWAQNSDKIVLLSRYIMYAPYVTNPVFTAPDGRLELLSTKPACS